jgi:predicted amidohydrolase YtcJ
VKTRRLVSLAFVAFGAAMLSASASAAVLVVKNVHGYTPTANGLQKFSALIVRDSRVERVLSAGEPIPDSPDAQTLDGQGRTLLPGLIDAHGHVHGLGQERLQPDLRGSQSVAEAVGRVRKFAADHADARWIVGRGWNQVLWPDRRFPTAQDLDAAISDRPVLLSRVDGHAIWVNGAALRLAGITASTPDPSGGQIIRGANNEPTGVLVDAATSLVERHVPKGTDQEVKAALTAAMRELTALGMTAVHDAGIDAREFRLYQELGAQGQLSMRIYAMLADSPEARALMAKAPTPAQFDDRLQMRAVKAWIDGALGSRGAAMMSDYSDQPQHRGLVMYQTDDMRALAKLCAANGWQLNVHAIGDSGNRMMLDTFEATMSAAQRAALRPRIEHAQIIALDDIPRFAPLNVIASMQPTHATSDMNMAEDRVGSARIQGAYAWRKLLKSGARLAGGSDFPVELPNPFHGLYAAVTRQDRDGRPPGGWYPQEKLTREEALRLFTLDAAYAAHMERVTGSIEAGKWADFILVDGDYFTVPEAQIDDLKVIATYVAGTRVAGR